MRCGSVQIRLLAGRPAVSLPVLTLATAFLDRLRHPTLFKLMLGLMLLSWLWPFDPIPFIDEIVTLMATLWLARLKKPVHQEPDSQPKSGKH